ncbi:MAG TPA: hypothetical protein VEC12_15350 [Bacteroidia bacterium]|nr:hypothetical protein [Bacteroidia bacterium]
MKKKVLFFILAFGIIATAVTSCKNDDPNPPAPPAGNNNNNNDDTLKKPKPSVSFNSGIGHVQNNDMRMPGDYFTYGITARSAKNEKLTKVRITIEITPGAEAVVFDSAFSDTVFIKNWTDNAILLPGLKKIKATVYQTNSQDSSVSVAFTIKPGPGAVATRTNIEMGAQNNASLGSFLDFQNLQVLTLAQANSKQNLVDVIHYYGATNKTTLTSADDAQVNQLFPSITNWAKRKGTRYLKTGMTASEFDALKDGDPIADIDANFSSGIFTSRANLLQVGDVVAFYTDMGLFYGLFKVTHVNTGSTGSIKLDLKYGN